MEAPSSDQITDPSEESGSSATFAGQTINISETGLSMAVNSPLIQADEIVVEFRLRGAAFTLPARVLWSVPMENGGDYACEVGIHFVKIRPREEDLIGTFIFEKQRLQLNKKFK